MPSSSSRLRKRAAATARERIDLLVDRGTFVEIGLHGRPHFSQRSMEGREAPADGVIRVTDTAGNSGALSSFTFRVGQPQAPLDVELACPSTLEAGALATPTATPRN